MSSSQETMKFIHQLPCYKVFTQGLGTGTLQYHVRLFSPHPPVQMAIFSMKTGTDRRKPEEVEYLANQVVKEFELNPDFVVWIEQGLPQFEQFSTAFNLVVFDWHTGQATNPRWLPIQEDWNLFWLEEAALESIVA
ncbi:MAG: hypothetical protein ACM37W_09570 [Actinomycetota bacterium]